MTEKKLFLFFREPKPFYYGNSVETFLTLTGTKIMNYSSLLSLSATGRNSLFSLVCLNLSVEYYSKILPTME